MTRYHSEGFQKGNVGPTEQLQKMHRKSYSWNVVPGLIPALGLVLKLMVWLRQKIPLEMCMPYKQH